MLCDSKGYLHSNIIGVYYWTGAYGPFADISYFRHSKKLNTLFLDGHAASVDSAYEAQITLDF